MTLRPVILLSLLQCSFSNTVKTVLPHYTLEMRNDCSSDYAFATDTASMIEYGTKMIEKNFDGLWYDADVNGCALYNRGNKEPLDCWRLVPAS